MKSRVMVVDDSKLVTKVTSYVLSSAGYEVEEVNSPFSVASTLMRFRPHLVLMDLNIPGLNGAKIIEFLTAKDYDFRFGIVVYSSEAEEALEKAGVLDGVCGCIRKGVTNEEFLSSVQKFMSMALTGGGCGGDPPETGGNNPAEFLRNATT